MRSALLCCAAIVASLAGVALATPADPAAEIAAPVGNVITYQGKLDKNGVPLTGSCNLIFMLQDAAMGGAQIGVTVTLSNHPVTNGFFTASLDFGAGAFNGQARWLEIQVQGPGDPSFTVLAPRQPITAAPYALYALGGPSTTSQWANDASGITYGSSVGVGTGSNSSIKLHLDAGTGDANALYAHNNSATWAAMVVRNLGTNGYGFYDDTSGRHHLAGKLAIGVLNGEGKLHATSSTEPAVFGRHTSNWVGVWGESVSSSGVHGESQSWVGTSGKSVTGTGVHGQSQQWVGVYGESQANAAGVWGKSATSAGVYGEAVSASGWGGYFRNLAGGTALHVDGKAAVKTLQILGGADLAERFATIEKAEPGTVMVIDPEAPGRMRVSREAYCNRVAGVVSGAESLPAGVVLGVGEPGADELPIALTGRVWVKCDAGSAPIRPGDLLTTSVRPGHAMAAVDPARSSGAILGKAMTALEAGTGMVLVLVSLQ